MLPQALDSVLAESLPGEGFCSWFQRCELVWAAGIPSRCWVWGLWVSPLQRWQVLSLNATVHETAPSYLFVLLPP